MSIYCSDKRYKRLEALAKGGKVQAWHQPWLKMASDEYVRVVSTIDNARGKS